MHEDITRAGRMAGLVTAGCIVVAGVAFIATAWDELTCSKGPSCEDWAGAAGLVSIGGLIAIGAGMRIVWTVWRRPLDEGGSGMWTWGLAFVFILSVLALALLIPVATCPAGTKLDAVFRVCTQGARRSPATEWTWAKWVVAVAGIAIGVAIGRLPRLIVLWAVVTSLTWVFALTWLLQETFAGGHA